MSFCWKSSEVFLRSRRFHSEQLGFTDRRNSCVASGVQPRGNSVASRRTRGTLGSSLFHSARIAEEVRAKFDRAANDNRTSPSFVHEAPAVLRAFYARPADCSPEVRLRPAARNSLTDLQYSPASVTANVFSPRSEYRNPPIRRELRLILTQSSPSL